MLPWNSKPLQIRDSSSVRPSSIPTTSRSAPTPYIRAGRHSTEAKQESEKSGSGFGRKVVFRAMPRRWRGARPWSVDRLDRDAEHVPGAALRENVARCRRFGLELAPQAHDLCIDRSVNYIGLGGPAIGVGFLSLSYGLLAATRFAALVIVVLCVLLIPLVIGAASKSRHRRDRGIANQSRGRSCSRNLDATG